MRRMPGLRDGALTLDDYALERRNICCELVQNMNLPDTAGSPVYSYLMSPHMQDPVVDILAKMRS